MHFRSKMRISSAAAPANGTIRKAIWHQQSDLWHAHLRPNNQFLDRNTVLRATLSSRADVLTVRDMIIE
jgi:hypothetical protein